MDRPLDTAEQVFRSLNATGAARFAQVAQVAGSLDRERLEGAIQAVQARHVALRRTVVRHEDRWWFRQSEEPAVLRMADVHDPRDLLLQEMRTELPGSVPFRVSFAPGPSPGTHLLGLSFHHSAVDGLSGRVVLDDLLLAASGSPLAPWPEASPLDDRAPALRSLLSPVRLRWRHLWVRFARALSREPLPPPVVWTRTGLTLRSIPATVVASLRSHAQARNASITGVLAAVGAAEVRKAHRSRRIAPVSISVSLREAVIPPVLERDLGCFVTTALVRAPRKPLWEMARSMTRLTGRQLVSGDLYEGLRATRPHVHQLDEHFTRMASSPGAHGRTPTLSISNRGDWQPGQTALQILKLFFVISSDPIGPWYELSADLVGGELHLCFSYVEPYVVPERAEAIADAICARLEALVRGEDGNR